MLIRKHIVSIAGFLASVLLLTSCTAYLQNTSQFTPLESVDCESEPAGVALFFEGEEVPQSYEKLGLITAEGFPSDTEQEVLDQLRYAAYQNCANSVLLVKKEYMTRSDDARYSSGRDLNERISSPVFSGIAVRVDPNAVEIPHDLSFIQRAKTYQAKRESTKNHMILLASGLTVGFFLLFFTMNNASKKAMDL